MFDAGKPGMIGLPYGAKILSKSLTVWVGCTNVTDDRQTDRRQTLLPCH